MSVEMTIEDAIKHINGVRLFLLAMNKPVDEYMTALDMAVKALEEHPKTGQWIERRNRATGHYESVCSVCGAEESSIYNLYCGNCGAEMQFT